MAFLMEMDLWPGLDGQQSIVSYETEAANCSPVNGHATIESLAADNWQQYDGFEAVLNMKGFGHVQSEPVMYGSLVEQQVNEFLPTSYEEGCISDSQILPLIQAANGVYPFGCPVVGMQTYAVQSSPYHKHSFVHLTLPAQVPVIADVGSEGTASPDIPMNMSSEGGNVMDLLSQLCDTVDGDMIIDQAGLAAPYIPLPQMSPEDVDSLLSSEFWSANAQVSTSVSSSDVIIMPPDSPVSDSGSMSSNESSGIVPQGERKRRKKEQNKTAALRYRQKKRCEQGSVMTECEDLEKRNWELKTKVSEMMKEIAYLKGLIEEIDA